MNYILCLASFYSFAGEGPRMRYLRTTNKTSTQ
jgi:hypothetical protein